MRIAPLVCLALALACAHSPAPPPGPRPLGMTASLARKDATLELRFRYEVDADRRVTLLVDLGATGPGVVGPVRLVVTGENFEVQGDSTWAGEVAADTATTERFVLRPRADGVARVTIEYGPADAAALERRPFDFVVEPGVVRPCQADDAVCKRP